MEQKNVKTDKSGALKERTLINSLFHALQKSSHVLEVPKCRETMIKKSALSTEGPQTTVDQ